VNHVNGGSALIVEEQRGQAAPTAQPQEDQQQPQKAIAPLKALPQRVALLPLLKLVEPIAEEELTPLGAVAALSHEKALQALADLAVPLTEGLRGRLAIIQALKLQIYE